MSHTYQVRDFAPKVAARLGREVVGDCIRYKADGGKLVLDSSYFSGQIDADVTVGGDAPYFVTFQSGAFRGDAAAKGTASVETMDITVRDLRMTPEEPFQEAKASVDLTKSEIIVAVGRGIKSQENIAIAQQLADGLEPILRLRVRFATANGCLSTGRSVRRARRSLQSSTSPSASRVRSSISSG